MNFSQSIKAFIIAVLMIIFSINIFHYRPNFIECCILYYVLLVLYKE